MKTVDFSRDGIKPDESYVQVPNALIDSGVNLGAVATYMAIRRRAWSVGESHYEGVSALAERRGVDRRTISRDLAALVSVNAIEVKRRGNGIPDVITVMPYEGIVALPDGTSTSLHTATSGDIDVSTHREQWGREMQSVGTSDAVSGDINVSTYREKIQKKTSEEEQTSSSKSENRQLEAPGAKAGGLRDDSPSASSMTWEQYLEATQTDELPLDPAFARLTPVKPIKAGLV